MPHAILKLLAQRVATPGLLQCSQLGMAIHALRQVGFLSVRSNALLKVILTLAPETDARSLAAIFHALALSTREQCEPAVAISRELHRSLVCVQDSLTGVTHDLTASDNILATEALLELFAFGSDVLRLRLLDELLERTLGLAYVVERPIDFIGILRVIKRLHQGHTISVVLYKGKILNMDHSTDLAKREATESGELELFEKRIQEWSEEAMTQVLSAVQVRLNTWSMYDIISILDALTVRTLCPLPESSFKRNVANTYQQRTTQHLMDAALPLLPTLIDIALKGLDEMSPSNCVAWVQRIAILQLYPNAFPLFIAIVRRFLNPYEQDKMTQSQVSSFVITLNRILTEIGESVGNTDASDVTSATRPKLTSLAPPVSASRKVVLSSEDQEACVRLFVPLFADVVFRIQQLAHDDSPNAEQAMKTELLPLLLRMSDGFFGFVDFTNPKEVAHLNSLSSFIRLLRKFCTTMEKACSLLLRHFASLAPRDQVDVVMTALRWNVYYASSSSLGVPEGETGGGHPEFDNFITSDDSKGVINGSNGVKYTGAQLMWMFPPLSHEVAERKLKALCGLIRQNIPQYNAMDVIKILNEMVVSMELPSSLISGDAGKGTQVPLSAREQNLFKDVYLICETLQDALVDPRLRNEMVTLPTFSLVRYLMTLSKLRVRRKIIYLEVLNLLSERNLFPFELITVLGIMGRNHLTVPHIISACIKRLGELGGILTPTRKALLLKYLAQTNGQIFVRAPVFAPLDGGSFFKSVSEINKLTYFESLFTFNGLMELQQYENQTLRWLLDGPLTAGLSGKEEPGEVSNQLFLNTITRIRSSTTIAEFLISLCRLGGPSEHVPLTLVISTMEVFRRRIASSRSLFLDLSLFLSYWPILSKYTALVERDATIHDPPLLSARAHVNESPSERLSTQQSSQIDKVGAAWNGVLETASPLIRERLLNILNSPQLRVNTFLFYQMAIGCCLDAMPTVDSNAERALVQHLDLRTMIEPTQNPHRLVDGLILVLYFIPRYPAETRRIVEFLLEHVQALRVQDALSMWSLLEDAFRMNAHLRTIHENSDVSAQTSATGLTQVRDILHRLREKTKRHVLKEQNVIKLSPMESRLMRELR
ncbi:unnamed protein product [Phytomonas sp. Hart1]|nr:unnamed protein product [Phytomonas sp. Hart1]|eukprot:CCW67737.1 unnamed protein product [Phytomonas sp. isolate Hart1]